MSGKIFVDGRGLFEGGTQEFVVEGGSINATDECEGAEAEPRLARCTGNLHGPLSTVSMRRALARWERARPVSSAAAGSFVSHLFRGIGFRT